MSRILPVASPTAPLLVWLEPLLATRATAHFVPKVKCILVQALRLCTGRTAHMGSRSIVLLFLDHDTRRGWEVSVTPRPLFTPGIAPVPFVEEAGWAPGPVWRGAENLDSPGFDPRTVQSVANRYIDWAIRPNKYIGIYIYFIKNYTFYYKYNFRLC